MIRTLVSTCVLLFAFVATVHAEDRWTAEELKFARSDAAAIKVREPDGYTVSVTIDGATRSQVIPAVIVVPNADDFITVTIEAKNNAKWSKKIEVKKYFVTELTVHHEAAGAPAANKPAKKYFGKLIDDAKHPCAHDNSATRVDFVDADGATVASYTHRETNVTSFDLAGGDYAVRTFRLEPNGNAIFRNTTNMHVAADGWVAMMGCFADVGAKITVK